jgi:hypothetical protein
LHETIRLNRYPVSFGGETEYRDIPTTFAPFERLRTQLHELRFGHVPCDGIPYNGVISYQPVSCREIYGTQMLEKLQHDVLGIGRIHQEAPKPNFIPNSCSSSNLRRVAPIS